LFFWRERLINQLWAHLVYENREMDKWSFETQMDAGDLREKFYHLTVATTNSSVDS
jgi:hypothetical protein